MIYLMRHGLDDETKIGGWSNGDLIDSGMKQVSYNGLWLYDKGITKIIASDIKRCVTSAKIMQRHIPVPIEYSSLLREQNKGLLNGMDKEEASVKYPEYISSQDIYKTFPEGESLFDLYKRVEKLLPWLLKQDKALIITHRGVINMLYFLLQDRLPDMDKKQFGVSHASIHVIENNKIKKLGGK